MEGKVIAALAGTAFCVAGIVVSLVLLEIPLNLFIAIPSAIAGGFFIFLIIVRPKDQQSFRVVEMVELEKEEE
jgi:hypothetical protein